MINATSIEFAYNKDEAFSFPAIQSDVDSPCLIIGPSGCGKSTLLHLLGGLMKPQSGSIHVKNTDLTSLTGTALDQFRGRNIGIIFQKPHFVRSLNVLENLLLAPYFGGKSVRLVNAMDILKNLGIADKINQSPSTLSQGEQQRLSIARVLINEPAVILADEPTSALDDDNCKEVIKLLTETAKSSNAALVIVTHDSRLKDVISNQVVLTKASSL